MKKLNICMIGASHVAALDMAWREIGPAFPDVTLRSIAGGGDFYKDFMADETAGILRVSPAHTRRIFGLEGEERTLDLRAYDLVLIVGGIFWWTGIDRRLYSQQVAGQALVEHLKAALAFPLVKTIRKISDIDIKLTHAPFLASRTPIISRSRGAYLQDIQTANALLFAPMGAQLLGQLEASMVAGMAQTKLAYMVGYKPRTIARPDMPAPEILDDLNHFNKAYGALLLVKILADYGITLPDGHAALPRPDGHLPLADKADTP